MMGVSGMESRRKKRGILQSLLAAAGVCLLTVIVGAFAQFSVPQQALKWVFLAGLIAALIASRRSMRTVRRVCIGIWVLSAAALAAFAVITAVSVHLAKYSEADNGKQALYAGKKVMLVVPHQDDEINLAGGVIEEYIRYGSEVYVVYVTNGDYRVPAEQRLKEAINALAVLGVDEENIIFLGYGDACTDKNGVALYNTDEQLTSRAGYSYTYTYDGHPPFREGRAYTRQNVLEDIRDVILEHRPDVIYGVDCDLHQDHQLTALMFDRAMGEILSTVDGYKPIVYKGFAYSTAYYAPGDFYQLNIKSTLPPSGGLRFFASGIYAWSDRVRMPVSAGSLSRAMMSSRLFAAALEHRSQDEAERAGQIINGDKVFWRRETTSLCYAAQVTASSGDAAVLTDFMLGDTSNVLDAANNVTGIWHSDPGDSEKSITVTFDEPQTIRRIKLYDDPSPESNILDAVISFDNGDALNTGALYALGTETVIETEENNVRSFTVSITGYEGDEPGLTEIEAYSGAFDAGVSFVKLMNRDSDFVYDYYIDPSGTERFLLYAYGCSPALGRYEISCTGDDSCRAYIDGESIVVECPVGKSCEVTVTDGVNSDTAVFRNSGSDELPYAMKADKYLLEQRWNLNAQEAIFQNLINNFDQVAQNYCNIKLNEIREKLDYLRWGIHRVGEIVFGA